LNIVGKKVLLAAVRTLGVKIQGPAKLELDVFTLLQKADFQKAYPLLVDVAFIMSKFGTQDEQTVAKKTVKNEIDPLAAQPALDNSSKMTQLGLSLQQKVGDAVLLTALRYLDGSITPAAAAGAPPAPPAAAATALAAANAANNAGSQVDSAAQPSPAASADILPFKQDVDPDEIAIPPAVGKE
jgi:hypothetical protein